MEKVNEQQDVSEKMMDAERVAFEAYRDKRNALLEGEGHAARSKWHVSNAHYPTWEAAIAYARSSLPVGVPDVDALANFIRFTDGNHKMGAGALAERICDWLRVHAAPTVKAEPVQCTNEDSWNCKYCRKTETCEALADKRNFGTPAPSLPSAGSAVEEPTSAMIQAACAAFRMDVSPMRAMQAALRAALSQQAEPAPAVDALSFVQPVPDHCDRIVWRERYYHLPLEAKAEPAPAQDEQAVAAVIGFYEGEREPRLLSWNVLPNGEHRLYTRPAQTEQPVNVPEGWSIELGFDVLDRAFRFVESKSHTPTIKVIFPPCEPVDSSAWDLRDEVARRIGSVLAAPIAQSAPQSAPERVSVPVEVARALLDDGKRAETWAAQDELRTLLANHAKTWKTNP